MFFSKLFVIISAIPRRARGFFFGWGEGGGGETGNERK